MLENRSEVNKELKNKICLLEDGGAVHGSTKTENRGCCVKIVFLGSDLNSHVKETFHLHLVIS